MWPALITADDTLAACVLWIERARLTLPVLTREAWYRQGGDNPAPVTGDYGV